MAKQLGSRFRVSNVMAMYEKEEKNAVCSNVAQSIREMTEIFEKELKENNEDYMTVTDDFMSDSKEYDIRISIMTEKEHLELVRAKRELNEIKKSLEVFEKDVRP